MPRPYPRSLADHPEESRPFSLFFSISTLHHPPCPVQHSPFTASIRVASDANPALRRLKHAVDKKQVCRVRQGALAGCKREYNCGRTRMNDRKGKRSSREPGVISILLPSSSLPYRLLHPSVRFHSRQLGIFRITLDIVFAASRVSFSLEIPSARRRDGLSSPVPFSIPFAIAMLRN